LHKERNLHLEQSPERRVYLECSAPPNPPPRKEQRLIEGVHDEGEQDFVSAFGRVPLPSHRDTQPEREHSGN
jgi:hypothetical protein